MKFMAEWFESLVKGHCEVFVGRKDTVQYVSEFLNQKQQKLLLIQAGPGVGKTALLARLSDEFGGCRHFLLRGDPSLCEPVRVLSNLGLQLAQKLKQPFDVAPSIGEATRALVALAARSDQRVILWLDGLDEALLHEAEGLRDHVEYQLAQALCDLSQASEDVHVVVTSRPGISSKKLLSKAPPETAVLELRSLSVQETCRLAKKFGRPAVGHKLFRASRGNPLFASLLLRQQEDDWKELPAELSGYFSVLLDRLPNNESRILLGVFCLAKSSLTKEEALEISGCTVDSFDGVDIFLTSDKHQRLRPFHQGLVDFFVASALPIESRARLVAWCSEWREHKHPYALKYYADHLMEVSSVQSLYVLARDPDYRKAQADFLTQEAAASLRVARMAMFCACEKQDVLEFAEFLLRCGEERRTLRRESPLRVLEQGHLERAWSVAEAQHEPWCIGWFLLLAWELADMGRLDEAREGLQRWQGLGHQINNWGFRGDDLAAGAFEAYPEFYIQLLPQLDKPIDRALTACGLKLPTDKLDIEFVVTRHSGDSIFRLVQRLDDEGHAEKVELFASAYARFVPADSQKQDTCSSLAEHILGKVTEDTYRCLVDCSSPDSRAGLLADLARYAAAASPGSAQKLIAEAQEAIPSEPPGRAVALAKLSYAYSTVGNLEAARDAARQSREITGLLTSVERRTALLHLSIAFHEIGDRTSCESAEDEFLALQPTWFGLKKLLDLQIARGDIDRALRTDPHSSDVARALASHGRLQEAIECHSDSPMAKIGLLMEAGRESEARNVAEDELNNALSETNPGQLRNRLNPLVFTLHYAGFQELSKRALDAFERSCFQAKEDAHRQHMIDSCLGNAISLYIQTDQPQRAKELEALVSDTDNFHMWHVAGVYSYRGDGKSARKIYERLWTRRDRETVPKLTDISYRRQILTFADTMRWWPLLEQRNEEHPEVDLEKWREFFNSITPDKFERAMELLPTMRDPAWTAAQAARQASNSDYLDLGLRLAVIVAEFGYPEEASAISSCIFADAVKRTRLDYVNQCIDFAAHCWNQSKNPELREMARSLLALQLSSGGRVSEGAELAHQALSSLDTFPLSATRIQAKALTARILGGDEATTRLVELSKEVVEFFRLYDQSHWENIDTLLKVEQQVHRTWTLVGEVGTFDERLELIERVFPFPETSYLPAFRERTLSQLCRDMAEADRLPEAERALSCIHQRWGHSQELEALACGYARARNFSEAVKRAERIGQENTRSSAYAGIALECIEAGNVDLALELADRIGADETYRFLQIAKKLSEAKSSAALLRLLASHADDGPVVFFGCRLLAALHPDHTQAIEKLMVAVSSRMGINLDAPCRYGVSLG